MTFSIKTKIISGEDSLEIFKELCPKKVFCVTDPFLNENGMINVILDKIPSGCQYKLFTDVKPDPSQELVDKAVSELLSYEADLVIAFGGGSAIDLAKAMIAGVVNDHNKVKQAFIAIPTTAGTGSEVTNFAVVTKGQGKVVLVDDLLLADYALLIPSVTKSVPPVITADTGMDVLTHALEAYMSKNANSFTDVFAIKAIKLVFDNLKVVFDDGMRMKSRQAMLEASCMAGIAFTNAGLGINHSLAHTIGGRFHIAHGRLNAILLPYVLEFNINRCNECKARMNSLANELGMNSYKQIIEHVRYLIESLSIPNKLSGLGKINVSEYKASINEMVENAMIDRCTPTSPGYLTKFDLSNLLNDVF